MVIDYTQSVIFPTFYLLISIIMAYNLGTCVIVFNVSSVQGLKKFQHHGNVQYFLSEGEDSVHIWLTVLKGTLITMMGKDC